jgi:glucokinase
MLPNYYRMNNKMIIGIDMGGTNIRAGVVRNGTTENIISKKINADGSADEVLQQVFNLIDQIISPEVKAIGIGFPGLAINGIAYDVYNIPSWKEMPLQQLVEQRYQKPVLINNDANCFALGEFYFGKGRGHKSLVGLTVGTGLGSGIIINQKLYSGKSGCAGEFGMIPYLDKFYEYYASGQFFQNIYGVDGETVFNNAVSGDKTALAMYAAFGKHFGNAIKTILYAVDPQLIVLGGSVRHAYRFFEQSMWQQIQTFELRKGLTDFKIEISELENSAILGAAALHYDLNEGKC